MNIRIQSLHFKATEELEAFVHAKVEKLFRINDRIVTTDVTLKLEKSDTHENKVCEIRLTIPGHELFAERKCKSFEEATSEVASALHDQLVKKRTQMDSEKKL